ncbi:hypothetical protein GCM10025868_07870 [Angustibacter aerolatus]|uniref:Uncharacterized protein n=1 Tax=Angustibacter aerolatus TaxID=1162965 RepID=A0ABQ6JCP5_9ACTN|nr:YbaK/EbsC family protein [Angustibacter aerolatus]GMA85537.1 hypothetical protein GCM10025868_07870 [Angustibacter aerolatus]
MSRWPWACPATARSTSSGCRRRLEPADVEPFTDADFDRHPALVKGYIGPGVLGEASASGIRYLVDPRVVTGTRWVTGADQPGRHVLDLVAGRDFTPDGVVEAAEVRAGDPAPDGSGPLEPGAGHRDGPHLPGSAPSTARRSACRCSTSGARLVTVTMGSYGIGVSRAVAAVAEHGHDEAGLVWPRELSPADVHLVATGKDAAVLEAADALATERRAAGSRCCSTTGPRCRPA